MKIDNVWDLEAFVVKKEAVPSIKFGIIGLGQGGSKIADAFASIKIARTMEPAYPVMVINSNIGDISSLKNVPNSNRIVLKNYERGVGKDPDVGKQALMENGAEVFDEIVRVMKNCEIIYVCGSMGGGTATGSINTLIDVIADHLGIPVASIISLPVPDEIESKNAFNAISELVPKLTESREGEAGRYRVLDNIIVLDNEKIIEEHLQDPEVKNITWDYFSNYKVASTLHEWNVITSLPSDITIDAADLKNHILSTGGILTFAKKKINLDRDVHSADDLIQQIVMTYKGKNVLANGFDYKRDTKAMAVCVVMPEERKGMVNQDILERVRKQLREEIPGSVYVGYVTWGSERNAIVYTIASMAGLPERAKNLRQEAQDLLEKRLERERQASGFQLGGKIGGGEALTQRRPLGSNPFTAGTVKTDSVAANPSAVRNPFRKD